jgi:hypothetical protein
MPPWPVWCSSVAPLRPAVSCRWAQGTVGWRVGEPIDPFEVANSTARGFRHGPRRRITFASRPLMVSENRRCPRQTHLGRARSGYDFRWWRRCRRSEAQLPLASRALRCITVPDDRFLPTTIWSCDLDRKPAANARDANARRPKDPSSDHQ